MLMKSFQISVLILFFLFVGLSPIHPWEVGKTIEPGSTLEYELIARQHENAYFALSLMARAEEEGKGILSYSACFVGNGKKIL